MVGISGVVEERDSRDSVAIAVGRLDGKRGGWEYHLVDIELHVLMMAVSAVGYGEVSFRLGCTD